VNNALINPENDLILSLSAIMKFHIMKSKTVIWNNYTEAVKIKFIR